MFERPSNSTFTILWFCGFNWKTTHSSSIVQPICYSYYVVCVSEFRCVPGGHRDHVRKVVGRPQYIYAIYKVCYKMLLFFCKRVYNKISWFIDQWKVSYSKYIIYTWITFRYTKGYSLLFRKACHVSKNIVQCNLNDFPLKLSVLFSNLHYVLNAKISAIKLDLCPQ